MVGRALQLLVLAVRMEPMVMHGVGEDRELVVLLAILAVVVMDMVTVVVLVVLLLKVKQVMHKAS